MEYLDKELIVRYKGKICDYLKGGDFDSAKRLTKKLILWIIYDNNTELVFELTDLFYWAESYFAYESGYKKDETEEFLLLVQEALKEGYNFLNKTEFLICVAQIFRDNGKEYREYVNKAIEQCDGQIKRNPVDMHFYYEKMKVICCFSEIEGLKSQLQETYEDAQVMILDKNRDGIDDDPEEWYINVMRDMLDDPKTYFRKKFQPKSLYFGLL